MTPKTHVGSIHELEFKQFAELGNAVKKVLGASKENGLKIAAFGNYGLIAGQTIQHLHVHLLPEKAELEVERARGLPLSELRKGAEFFDPLTLPILHYLKSKGSLPENADVVERRVGKGFPALVLRFSSFDELFSKKGFGTLQQAFEESVKAFEHLKQNPEDAVLPPGYKPEFGKQIGKLLRERTTQGFGVNWSIREAADGSGVEFVFVPRATAIDVNDLRKRLGNIEVFTNIKLQRSGLTSGEEKEWDAREKKFKGLVRKALK